MRSCFIEFSLCVYGNPFHNGLVLHQKRIPEQREHDMGTTSIAIR